MSFFKNLNYFNLIFHIFYTLLFLHGLFYTLFLMRDLFIYTYLMIHLFPRNFYTFIKIIHMICSRDWFIFT